MPSYYFWGFNQPTIYIMRHDLRRRLKQPGYEIDIFASFKRTPSLAIVEPLTYMWHSPLCRHS
jgi:hypothetical protein